jgi:type II secretory ATPase GspE/PulE/Tfp pilus assembly ATPase PilB-like protein
VRTLCSCAIDETLTAEERDRAFSAAETGGVLAAELADGWRKPVGCDACAHMGYRGRRVIAESVRMTPSLREALVDGADIAELRTIAIADGTTTLAADGIRRASAGETTLAEVWRVLGIRSQL